MNYYLADIAAIIKATGPVDDNTIIEHLLFDSRKVVVPASSLFFALKGARRNGHLFIPELYRKGVRNFVVMEAQQVDDFPDANFLQVADSLQALQQLAAHHRARFNIPIVGITGSNGKTIIKEWLYQLLKDDVRIVRSPKSFNSQIGVPLSVWLLQDNHELGIFEAGISMPGEMEKLERIIQPTIGILSNIGDTHNEGFRDNNEKLEEKIKLFAGANLVICHSKDDPGKKLLKNSGARIVYCGNQPEDDIRIHSLNFNRSSVSFSVTGRKKERDSHFSEFKCSIPFTDEASIENALLCIAFIWEYLPDFKSKEEIIRQRLLQLEPVEMRMELKKGINNCYIINDSYSNDLSSLGIALDYLKQQGGNYSSTVILSDIPQSGIEPGILYRQVASELKARNVQRLIGIGPQLSSHFLLFKEALPEVSFFLSTDNFLDEAISHQFRENFILLKGARSFAFERISKWLEQKVHQTVLEINLNAIVHNLKEYQRILKPNTKVMAMVKAFAYGSGGAEIAGVLQYHKVDYLGVAYADEGVDLRKSGISLPVMVMNPEENSYDLIVEHNLEPEIYSFEGLLTLDAFLRDEGIQFYPVHIEIETGMNRLGFTLNDIPRLADFLRSSSSFRIQSVFTHLAASEDVAEDVFTLGQYKQFIEASDQLQSLIGYSFIRHIANSAAVMRHSFLHMDMVRLGIGLYGVDSSGSGNLSLQTVATLKSTVAQIKHLKAGESVGYNRKAVMNQDAIIATIRLGYADGYSRRLGNGRGKVVVRQQEAPVVGTVCMDMTMIDITHIPGVEEGDEVIVFGEQLPVQQVAEWAGTIPYEIMTGVSQRVKRVYYEE